MFAARVPDQKPLCPQSHLCTHTPQSGRKGSPRLLCSTALAGVCKITACARVCYSTGPEKGAPVPAVLQYRVDAWSEGSKHLFHLPFLKIRLICSPHIEDISDIKLIRTDTTLDLSQKAEKRYLEGLCGDGHTLRTVTTSPSPTPSHAFFPGFLQNTNNKVGTCNLSSM